MEPLTGSAALACRSRGDPQMLDEPVPSRWAGLLEKRCVGVEVTAVKGEQLLGLRGGFVHLALNLGECASVVFGEDHQQRLGCHIGKPARGLELDEILQRANRCLVVPDPRFDCFAVLLGKLVAGMHTVRRGLRKTSAPSWVARQPGERRRSIAARRRISP